MIINPQNLSRLYRSIIKQVGQYQRSAKVLANKAQKAYKGYRKAQKQRAAARAIWCAA